MTELEAIARPMRIEGSAAPIAAARALWPGERPRASSARVSSRTRAVPSASAAPIALQSGASGSVRPARTPAVSCPSSLAAVTSHTTTIPMRVAPSARAKVRRSQAVIGVGGRDAEAARKVGPSPTDWIPKARTHGSPVLS